MFVKEKFVFKKVHVGDLLQKEEFLKISKRVKVLYKYKLYTKKSSQKSLIEDNIRNNDLVKVHVFLYFFKD